MQKIMLPADVFEKVVKKYTEPHRVYHDITHINQMFAVAETLGIELTAPQELAIIFHDVVYNIGDDRNEEKSVEFMEYILPNNFISQDDLSIAKRIILDTVNHDASIPESKIVLDLDLMRLAFPFEEFLLYREKIKLEYGTVFSEVDFYQGEIRFFEELLRKERVFFTNHFPENSFRENAYKKILINISRIKELEVS
jgi:predicted metal-dependent HD superfamily phosphohydrolase